MKLVGILAVTMLAAGLVLQGGCHNKSKDTTPPPPGDDLEAAAASHNQGEGEDEDTGPTPSPEKIEEVQRVFRLGRMELEQCFNDYVNRTKNPNLKGFIIISVKVGMSPKASQVKIFKSSPRMKDPQFVRCVIERVKNWDFPTWGGLLELTSPKYSFLGS